MLGVLPGIIGSIQALETLKLILGAGDTLVGRLVLFDALKFRFRELTLRKDPKKLCRVEELLEFHERRKPMMAGPERVEFLDRLDGKGWPAE